MHQMEHEHQTSTSAKAVHGPRFSCSSTSISMPFSVCLFAEMNDKPVRKLMAVQAPPAVAALLLLPLSRLASDVIPTPDAFLNSSTFVSVRKLCNTAVLHTMPALVSRLAWKQSKDAVPAAVVTQPDHPSP
jgi:hypothetical protein